MKRPKPAVDPKDHDHDADGSNDDSIGVGSIAAGGRYDELVGMFSQSAKRAIPCVGISFGVDRIFSIKKAKMDDHSVRLNEVDVFVMAFGGGLLKERMQIARTLWDAGIKVIPPACTYWVWTNMPQAEFSYKVKPKLQAQFKAAETNGVPFAVILGEEELARGEVKLKELGLPEGHLEKEGVTVSLENLTEEVKKRITEDVKKRIGRQTVSTVDDPLPATKERF